MKEGGGPKAELIVLNFLVPIRGEGRGSMNLGQNPQIFLFFFLKASLISVFFQFSLFVLPKIISYILISCNNKISTWFPRLAMSCWTWLTPRLELQNIRTNICKGWTSLIKPGFKWINYSIGSRFTGVEEKIYLTKNFTKYHKMSTWPE